MSSRFWEKEQTKDTTGVLEVLGQIVSAYVAQHKVEPAELTSLIQQTFTTLKNLQNATGNRGALHPAVDIASSVTESHLICLEDGKKLKMLKRHLRTSYKMTPEEYRAKWGLPPDYPMVAAGYAAKRSSLAKFNGLGRASKAREAAAAQQSAA